jgi:hypothetical protein
VELRSFQVSVGEAMRMLIVIAGAVGTLMLSADAQAETCQELAASCVKNGGDPLKCYGEPLVSCKRTCIYVAYGTGKNWPASGDCTSGKKKKSDAKDG